MRLRILLVCSLDFLNNKLIKQKLNLITYGILYPKVRWLEIPSTIEIEEKIHKKIVCVSINENNKDDVLSLIQSYQPNIIIFAGTFAEFEPSEMENIGWNISYSAKRYVNDEQLGNTTAFYITSPTRLCIETFNLDDYHISDKMFWYEIKKAVELWEEFR